MQDLLKDILEILGGATDFLGGKALWTGVILLVLDILLNIIIIRRVISWRDNKRWQPLRLDIYQQAKSLVSLIFHVGKTALRNDKKNELDGDMTTRVYKMLQEASRAQIKLSDRLTMYGSGLGEKMLPQMAKINEEAKETILYLQFTLHPFLEDKLQEDSWCYNTFNFSRLDAMVDSLMEASKSLPRRHRLKNSCKNDTFDKEWIERYYEKLPALSDRIITNPADVKKMRYKKLVSLGIPEMSEVIQFDEAKEMVHQTIRSY